ncbi:ketopantoate reductase PanE/ApbA-domain-containing protein [Dactylonectria macrodidyma]|uniref:2-dehydropantoate 2-reductase n=1 Tax=Dactylonectria macrodidyma TaxID=307937 RepID=A0A9P9D0L7_9HYPO|nr:ketopantoate reductase PanE/ApbA-domain-containing protein [Dactylonectria macrodidyma]
MARALILGMGSIGTVYALILNNADVDLVCICRSNFEEAQTAGFKVRSSVFGDHTIRPKIARSVADAVAIDDKHFDFVLVCTKSFPGSQNSTVQALEPALQSSSTMIVLLQNGLGVESDYRTRYPNNPIISGVVYMPTTKISANEVVHTEVEKLFIGSYPASQKAAPGAHQLADLFSRGGATVQVEDDVQVERWKKIVANGCWNPVCALSACRDVAFLGVSPLALGFVRSIMEEICAVAAAVGYEKSINNETVDFQMARSAARSWPGVEPSMMSDMKAGARMEVEAIIGSIVRIAKEKSLEVPRLETLYLLLAGLSSSVESK